VAHGPAKEATVGPHAWDDRRRGGKGELGRLAVGLEVVFSARIVINAGQNPAGILESGK